MAQEWRSEANQRIEQHRMADLTVEVVDADGKAVSVAEVHVAMQRHSFGFGTAVTAAWITRESADGDTYRRKLIENFNQVVFENDMKYPRWIGLSGRRSNWSQTARALDWLTDHNLPTRGHYLSWAAWSGRDAWGPSQDVDTLPERILDHISEKLSTVGTRVFEWDVINHPVGWLNDSYENRLEEAGLYEEGLDFYVEIIKHARAIIDRPQSEGGLDGADLPLWINEDDIIAGDSRAAEYERVIDYLIEHGAAPGGIGFQAHFVQEWGRLEGSSPKRLYERIDRFAKRGLPLRATEFDIDVGADEARHGELMRDYLTVMFSHPAMEAVTQWGFWAGAHWRPTAALYRQDWTARPALDAYRDLVFDAWWTDETGQTDRQGRFKLRAFKGEYEVTVAHAGQEYRVENVLVDGQTDLQVVVAAPPSGD